MNKYTLISLIALLLFVAVFPLYGWVEPARMKAAQTDLRRQFLADGAEIFLNNCAPCHGTQAQGLGAMPSLNNPALAKAEHSLLYETIAHSPHGSAMAAWHVSEGGTLNSYQVESLVNLIMHGDWQKVGDRAIDRGLVINAPPLAMTKMEAMDIGVG